MATSRLCLANSAQLLVASEMTRNNYGIIKLTEAALIKLLVQSNVINATAYVEPNNIKRNFRERSYAQHNKRISFSAVEC